MALEFPAEQLEGCIVPLRHPFSGPGKGRRDTKGFPTPGEPPDGGGADGDDGAPRVPRLCARPGPAPARTLPRGGGEGLDPDPPRDREGSGDLERVPDPRARQSRGPLRPRGTQDPAERDVSPPGSPQGARPNDVRDRGDALRLLAAHPVGGGFPLRRDPQPEDGRDRRDGVPAPPPVREDAVDEPRPERACAEPRRPEVLREPHHLAQEMRADPGAARSLRRLTAARWAEVPVASAASAERGPGA